MFDKRYPGAAARLAETLTVTRLGEPTRLARTRCHQRPGGVGAGGRQAPLAGSP